MEDTVNTLADIARAKLQSLSQDSITFLLLNALLTHAPTADGVDIIATDIIAAYGQPNGFDQLAEFYKTGLLLPMKAGGQTPQASYHPSRDQGIKMEANAIIPVVDLEIAKKDQATLKKYVDSI